MLLQFNIRRTPEDRVFYSLIRVVVELVTLSPVIVASVATRLEKKPFVEVMLLLTRVSPYSMKVYLHTEVKK